MSIRRESSVLRKEAGSVTESGPAGSACPERELCAAQLRCAARDGIRASFAHRKKIRPRCVTSGEIQMNYAVPDRIRMNSAVRVSRKDLRQQREREEIYLSHYSCFWR